MSAETERKPGMRIVSDSEIDEPMRYETAAEVKAEKPVWLLPGKLIANGMSILEGDQGVGKSTLISGLVSSITTGKKWWSRGKGKPQNVLWLAGEEDPGTAIKPRLIAAKADMGRVYFPKQILGKSMQRLYLPNGLGVLQYAIMSLNLSLIVIDPLVCYCDGNCDLNSELGARAVVDPLNMLAMETGCGMLITRHLRKDRSGPRNMHGMGSVAIGAAARSIIVIDYPDHRTEKRICRVVKKGIAPRTSATEFTFSYVGGVPILSNIRDLPRDEEEETGDLADAGERDVRQDARLLLRRILATDWVMTSAVISEAKSAGIGERTLRMAKAELGVRARRVGTATPAHWEWGPPTEGW